MGIHIDEVVSEVVADRPHSPAGERGARPPWEVQEQLAAAAARLAEDQARTADA